MGARATLLKDVRDVLEAVGGLNEHAQAGAAAGLPQTVLKRSASGPTSFVITPTAVEIREGERHRSIARIAETLTVSVGTDIRQATRSAAYGLAMDLEDSIISAVLGAAIEGWQQRLTGIEREVVAEGAVLISAISFTFVASLDFGS